MSDCGRILGLQSTLVRSVWALDTNELIYSPNYNDLVVRKSTDLVSTLFA